MLFPSPLRGSSLPLVTYYLLPAVAEAVFARMMSSEKKQRVEASKVLLGPEMEFDGDKKRFVDATRDALYASKVCSYAQGFSLLEAASK